MPPAAPADLAVEPLTGLDDAWATWPRGDRPGALRAAATELRARLRAGGSVAAVRTVDLDVREIPAGEILDGARGPLLGDVPVVHRMLVARFRDLAGDDRVLVWDPRAPDAPAAGGRAPGTPPERDSVATGLAVLGLRPDDVDVCGLSHLHGQDPRLVLGTEVAVATDRAPRAPLLPRATVLVQRRETDTLRAPHPLQRPRYPGALHGCRTDRLHELDGSVLLGPGVAVLATPGHTDGHQSLALATDAGIWVVSGAAHLADAWHPYLSRSPGVRASSEDAGEEVLVPDGAEDPIDQHDAMLLERAVADAHHADPRWRCVLPVAEVLPSRSTWPLRATFLHGGLHAGVLRARD